MKNPLGAPARPLSPAQRIASPVTWNEMFPETAAPRHKFVIVLVWSTWSAHSGMALQAAQHARNWFQRHGRDVGVLLATDPVSRKDVGADMLRRLSISLSQIPLDAHRLRLTEATNQVPSTLLFENGIVLDRRLL
jgi:hypothetical protein